MDHIIDQPQKFTAKPWPPCYNLQIHCKSCTLFLAWYHPPSLFFFFFSRASLPLSAKQRGVTQNGSRGGVDRHWLGIILFVLSSETGPATRRQRGSVASLTFPFSSSQLALAHPFISIDSCFLRCVWASRDGELGIFAGAGWIGWAFTRYEDAHAGLRSLLGTGTDGLQGCTHKTLRKITHTEASMAARLVGKEACKNSLCSFFSLCWEKNVFQLRGHWKNA